MLPWAFDDGMGFERLRRLRARRADVFRQARRQIYRRVRQVVPRFLRRQARRTAGRAADHFRLGQSPVDDLPRGAAQALPRNARRRRRAVAAAAVARRLLGRAALRRRFARRPAGTWSKAGARRSGRSCATTCPSSALPPRSAAATCSRWRRRRCALPRAGWRAANFSTATAATRRAICGRWRRAIARGITPAEELLEKFHGPWKGSVEPIFEEYAY